MQVITPNNINYAVAILKNGGVGAYPTDTVFGLGASVFNEKAATRVYDIKGRPDDKGLPVLVDSVDTLEQVADVYYTPQILRLIERFWPGKLTMIFRKKANVPSVVCGGGQTIAVRIPNCHIALSLIKVVGPIIGTSANISGQGNSFSSAEVERQLGDLVDFIIEGNVTGGVPSTVINTCSDKPQIVRAGAIPLEEIEKALKD
ncbi:MAG: L-threonylcarbamoyladenylate synthase [Chloroflexi bacterium]|nr:L-threonylcarbamoyladenylate synthase [Chloroflexota bacterium]